MSSNYSNFEAIFHAPEGKSSQSQKILKHAGYSKKLKAKRTSIRDYKYVYPFDGVGTYKSARQLSHIRYPHYVPLIRLKIMKAKFPQIL